ncbi:ABC transporter permease [Chryseolinea sp. T2]|uniref:ABC transporter permease n=1 Tax=Chryseolinea sp. T2 TaxID=3129255 RepID=UPI003078189C
MLTNYLKTAWRNLTRGNSFTAINIIGLSIGMTCCLIIFQYVTFESSFDDFHENKATLFRVLQGSARDNQPMEQLHGYTARALMPALQAGVPEIVSITRVHDEQAIVTTPARPGEVFEESKALYADPDFFRMFSFPVISGDPLKGLSSGNVFISEAAARKYFGNGRAEGQVLEIAGNIRKPFTVAGVFKNPPANSHLQFDMLLPVDDLLKGEDYASEGEGGWSWNNFTTYVQLHPTAKVSDVEQKMTGVFNKHRGDFYKEQRQRGALGLQPLSDIHLNDKVFGAGTIVSGSYRTVYFFLVIGVCILVIALVNYINLATARAVNRAREVGVRKSVGARHAQLIIQFLFESAFTNISALIIALALSASMLNFINDLAETRLSIEQWSEPGFFLVIILMLLSGTLLAGLYPAFVLSSFRPATVLKGKVVAARSGFTLRKSLVVFQFAACIVLISGTVIVSGQLDYMRNMELGLNLKQVVSVRAPRVLSNDAVRTEAVKTFVNEVRRIPQVEAVALSTALPGTGFNWNGASIRKATDIPANALRGVATYIDSAFSKLYGLELVAGNDFGSVMTTDTTSWLVVVNESTSKHLGYATPTHAIDEILDIGGYRARIIGVYKDFRWSSGHTVQQNIVFGHTDEGQQLSIRLAGNASTDVIEKVESLYRDMFPGNIFQYAFVDETFDLQYKNDQRFARLFSVFAGITIFIACLGLFGLVAFTAQQRWKEIGIRKVAGASAAGIVALLSKDFLKLVVIGFALAVPITYYVMSRWLEGFADRMDIGVGTFLMSGAIALLIALLTVGWQSFKAATANPVKSLRSE